MSLLAADLDGSRGPLNLRHTVLLWLASGWTIVLTAMLMRAPMREGFATQLLSSPQFLVESLVGLAAGVWLITSAVNLGIPSLTSKLKRSQVAIMLAAVWVAFYVAGLSFPALDPAMLGKREGCEYETFLLSIPLIATGLFALREFAPTNRAVAGALLGAAAGAVPALLMEFGCMYIPHHILTNHVAPVLGSIALGAMLGPLVLRKL